MKLLTVIVPVWLIIGFIFIFIERHVWETAWRKLFGENRRFRAENPIMKMLGWPHTAKQCWMIHQLGHYGSMNLENGKQRTIDLLPGLKMTLDQLWEGE